MPRVIYHVRFRCADDYMARRLPYRPAHLRQLDTLRGEGRVVAGGPEPDGAYANIFYRVADRAELDRLLADNEFTRAGLFADSLARAFVDFLAPVELLPLDAGLKVTIVEGPVDDRARARAGLAELQRDCRIAFGGFFGDGAGLAIVRLVDPGESIRVLSAAGGWTAGSLVARAWSQTL